MKLEKDFLICELFDLYGKLLTVNQQNIIRDYYFKNLSLGEIAENNKITRQAIYDTIKKATTILKDLESKLKLQKKFALVKKTFANNELIKNEILNILYE